MVKSIYYNMFEIRAGNNSRYNRTIISYRFRTHLFDVFRNDTILKYKLSQSLFTFKFDTKEFEIWYKFIT